MRFLFPHHFNTIRTNKQTHTQTCNNRVLIIQAAHPRYARPYNFHSGLRPSLVFRANTFSNDMPDYLNTVKCNEILTKIIHPLSLRHVFCHFVIKSTVCNFLNPSPPWKRYETFEGLIHRLIILRETYRNYLNGR